MPNESGKSELNTRLKDPRIIIALDYETKKQAMDLLDRLDPKLCRLKVGKEMFTRYGPSLVNELIKKNYSVFLDLKFHDIPNTVAGACVAAAELGVWMINLHVLGGVRMLEAARNALDKLLGPIPMLIGVTLLTSLEESDCKALGLEGDANAIVSRFAKIADEAGLDGVVCSPREVTELRSMVNKEFQLVTPGIRLDTDAASDQKRIMTPSAAMKAGSDYLVIGRSITQASDPLKVLKEIRQQI